MHLRGGGSACATGSRTDAKGNRTDDSKKGNRPGAKKSDRPDPARGDLLPTPEGLLALRFNGFPTSEIISSQATTTSLLASAAASRQLRGRIQSRRHHRRRSATTKLGLHPSPSSMNPRGCPRTPAALNEPGSLLKPRSVARTECARCPRRQGGPPSFRTAAFLCAFSVFLPVSLPP